MIVTHRELFALYLVEFLEIRLKGFFHRDVPSVKCATSGEGRSVNKSARGDLRAACGMVTKTGRNKSREYIGPAGYLLYITLKEYVNLPAACAKIHVVNTVTNARARARAGHRGAEAGRRAPRTDRRWPAAIYHANVFFYCRNA